MAKNILITGANGQLGNEMRKAMKEALQFNVFYTDVNELDITDVYTLNTFIAVNDIDTIVNCAAYTAVDKAEEDEQLCDKLNHIAVENIAKAAAQNDAKVVHISTDYVFDGTSCTPYKETDKTCPQSVYGSTKLAGEQSLALILPNDHVIIRTAWLYSSFGNNFVKTMLNLGKSRDSLNVVADQIGTPTYAGDLADAILVLLKKDDWSSGIYHFSNEGACSWYDFTKMIHKLANISTCSVSPIRSSEYPAKAHRPSFSVLDKSKIKKTLGITIPFWVDSLEKCLKELNEID